MKGITQTREVIRAAAAVGVRLVKDLEDGKISIAEGIGFASEFNTIRTAVSGIQEVPSELADLTDEEKDILLQDINEALTAAGLSHRIADAAEKILRWAYTTVRTFIDIKTAPPSAVAV